MPAAEEAVEVRVGDLVIAPVQGYRDRVAQVIQPNGSHSVGESALWSLYCALLDEAEERFQAHRRSLVVPALGIMP